MDKSPNRKEGTQTPVTPERPGVSESSDASIRLQVGYESGLNARLARYCEQTETTEETPTKHPSTSSSTGAGPSTNK